MSIRNLFFLTLIIVLLSLWSYCCFDLVALQWVKAHPNATIDLIAKIVQHSLSFLIWGWLTPLMLIILWWRSGSLRQAFRRQATQFWLGLFIAMLLCFVIKTMAGRYRPEIFLTQHLYGFAGGFTYDYFKLSMPSDHTALIFSMITSIAFISRAKFLTLILTLIGLGLAASRVMYLKHYPSDVGIGILVGVWSSYIAFWIGKRFK